MARHPEQPDMGMCYGIENDKRKVLFVATAAMLEATESAKDTEPRDDYLNPDLKQIIQARSGQELGKAGWTVEVLEEHIQRVQNTLDSLVSLESHTPGSDLELDLYERLKSLQAIKHSLKK